MFLSGRSLLPRPLIKWVGGKQNLLKFLLPLLPKRWNRWIEPFLGGGGMFFGVCPDRAVLNDANPQLVNFHRQVQADPFRVRQEALRLNGWTSCTEDMFLARRKEYNSLLKDGVLDCISAAYFLWLSKHSFNGLYRLNGKGEYNAPWNREESGSRSASSALPSAERFAEVSDALSKAEIFCGSFKALSGIAGEGDLVFLDPPYLPDPKGGNFTSYTKDGFSMEDHLAVAEFAREARNRGACVLATNNDSSLARQIYEGFSFRSYSTSQCIRPGRKRSEIAILGYEPEKSIDAIAGFC